MVDDSEGKILRDRRMSMKCNQVCSSVSAERVPANRRDISKEDTGIASERMMWCDRSRIGFAVA